jgi:hypothetical protein
MEDGMTRPDRDDAALLTELAREMPRIDVDEARARQIGQHTRGAVGRGAPASRFVEPILVVLLELSVVGWTVVKLIEVLR